MRGIVWGSTVNKAEIKLNEIMRNYLRCGINVTRIAKGGSRKFGYGGWLEFENGDRWFALAADCTRCYIPRSQISYIDKEINQNTVDEILRHHTASQPYQGVTYF